MCKNTIIIKVHETGWWTNWTKRTTLDTAKVHDTGYCLPRRLPARCPLFGLGCIFVAHSLYPFASSLSQREWQRPQRRSNWQKRVTPLFSLSFRVLVTSNICSFYGFILVAPNNDRTFGGSNIQKHFVPAWCHQLRKYLTLQIATDKPTIMYLGQLNCNYSWCKSLRRSKRMGHIKINNPSFCEAPGSHHFSSLVFPLSSITYFSRITKPPGRKSDSWRAWSVILASARRNIDSF